MDETFCTEKQHIDVAFLFPAGLIRREKAPGSRTVPDKKDESFYLQC